MDLAIALRVLAGWPPFNQLQPKEQARLAETLQPLQLRPGQKLFEHGSLPPGVAYVVKGQLRLLAQDENGEPFTLKRIDPGSMVGERSLLRARLAWHCRPPCPPSCGYCRQKPSWLP